MVMAAPVTIPYPSDANNVLNYVGSFVTLVKILRKECPWDREQTHESISHLLIEEAYETLEAIHDGNDDELRKELGDLLLHVVMHAVIAEQRGAFSLVDVVHGEFTKLVNRHPHVFGNERTDDPSVVLKNWETLKMKEGRTSILDGVPKALPAALRAQRVQEKAANAGFDWEDTSDVWKKVHEEIGELQDEVRAGRKQQAAEEFGDVMFALINAARHYDIIAEDALHGTTNRFMKRFQFIEAAAKLQNRQLAELSLAEMDELWDAAKRIERQSGLE